jgi:hypothetical protein
MKATFFSLCLAAVASAAPLVPQAVAADVQIGELAIDAKVDAAEAVTSLTTGVVSTAETTLESVQLGRRQLSTSSVITTFTDLSGAVTAKVAQIEATLDQVAAGTVSRLDAINEIKEVLSDIYSTTSAVVHSFSGVSKLSFAPEEIDTITKTVATAIGSIINVTDKILSTLGLDLGLQIVLASVFSIITSLLQVVIGLLGNVLPTISDLIQSIVVGSGILTLLAPLLTPLTNLLPGLNIL